MSVQSIVFKRRYWTKDRAVEWLLERGYTFGKLHITKNTLRFRQTPPEKDAHYISKYINPSILIVYKI